MAWRITDWEQFEPAKRSDRECNGPLRWWKCPVSQNMRYKGLVRDHHGWQLLGIWHALVASWARQTRNSRQKGFFRGASTDDTLATLAELSDDTLVPKRTLKIAITRFVELGWLSIVIPNDIPNDIPTVYQWYSETRLDKTREEKKEKKEEKEKKEVNQEQKEKQEEKNSPNTNSQRLMHKFCLNVDDLLSTLQRSKSKITDDRTEIAKIALKLKNSAQTTKILDYAYTRKLDKLKDVLTNKQIIDPIAIWTTG